MSQLDLFNDEKTQVYYAELDLDGLFELSVDAYYTALNASMSELPIKNELIRFVEKVKSAGVKFGSAKNGSTKNGDDRKEADKAASDRGDPDVCAVLSAAGKVQHELHRLFGMLRFRPDANGVFTARCAPDHFCLPAMADHFTMRFGDTPWAIIDEKRSLCLCRQDGGDAKLIPWSLEDAQYAKSNNSIADSWEDLWRLYNKTISIEGRKNLKLQHQLMPERYRRYLTEITN